jgi:KDO2-lipid IV(A) lauroyltransferase
VNPGRLAVALLVRSLSAGVEALSWRRSLALGAALGDSARILGVRRQVAEHNLAQAFPEKTPEERAQILVEHYRELGRVACEYARLPALVGAPPGEVVAEVRGLEHLIAARDAGRGAILLTGHFGHFELLGAYLGRTHPVDFVVKGLSNPAVEAWIGERRRRAGVGSIPVGAGVRRVFEALRQNRWVAMVADQDARGRGVFVPFLGRSSSTPIGPAEIAIRTGAPLVMGFGVRGRDGRHRLDVLPPLPVPATDRHQAAVGLTARHVACLEDWIRRYPASWFWLHRRWKTAPAGAAVEGSA